MCGFYVLLIFLSLLRFKRQDVKAMKAIEEDVGIGFNYMLENNPPKTHNEYVLLELEAKREELIRKRDYLIDRLSVA